MLSIPSSPPWFWGASFGFDACDQLPKTSSCDYTAFTLWSRSLTISRQLHPCTFHQWCRNEGRCQSCPHRTQTQYRSFSPLLPLRFWRFRSSARFWQQRNLTTAMSEAPHSRHWLRVPHLGSCNLSHHHSVCLRLRRGPYARAFCCFEPNECSHHDVYFSSSLCTQ